MSLVTHKNPSLPEMLHELYRMVKPDIGEQEIPRFRFGYFNFLFLTQAAALFPISYLLLVLFGNEQIIRVNLAPDPKMLALALPCALLVLCKSEFFLHLHPMHQGIELPAHRTVNWLNRWLASIRHSHDGTHHRVTKIGRLRGNLQSDYPIMNAEQTASATFPKMSLAIFWGILSPLAVGVQLIFQKLPFLLAFALAISWAVWIYETVHALHHFPDEWWRKQCRRRYVGWVFMRVHAHHFVHHLNSRRNLSVGGFLLVWLADLLFGTYRYPKELMEAWLANDPNTDWNRILQGAITYINKPPWSFQIRSKLRSVFQR